MLLPRHLRIPRFSLLLAICGLVACGLPACGTDGPATGGLSLALTTQSAGVSYRLADARFTLAGPETRELMAAGEDELSVSLPEGAYRLTLHEGYRLMRVDGGETAPVDGRLISQNPAPVLIVGGETARITLRFDLSSPPTDRRAGTLHVDVAIGPASDAGVASAADAACALGLRINELDYDQPSSDAQEFVELLNPGMCSAPLSEVALELINGSDGRPYGRYPLGDAGPELGAGERLVVGDADVLARLPMSVKRVMLSGSGLQNGPDAVRVVLGERIVDAVAYKEAVPGSGEGAPTGADEGAPALARCPDGTDSGDNASDLAPAAPSPGAVNTCKADQNRSATMPSSKSQR
jgi:hypothetical protein